MHAMVPREGNGDLQAVCDEELLRRFVDVRQEAAFEEIVRRHGPLVMSVCRRMLDRQEDVEDVFQATFLTLASRAGKIKSGIALPSWLHRVATHIARDVRRRNRQRQRTMHEQDLSDATPEAAGGPTLELQLVLDDELDRLPTKYRAAILLCDYYGYSRKEAAQKLKIPTGTLLTHLRRGRELLRKRLLRCGVAVSAAGLASAFGRAATVGAHVPMELVASTVRSSLLFLAGQSATKAAAPATAVHLAQSTIWRMTMMKLLSVSMLCVAVGTIAVAVPEIAQTNLAQAQPFFVDDFEDGDISDGRPVSWLPGSFGATSQVTGGDLVLNGTIEALYVEGSDAARDVSLRTQFRFLTSSGTSRNVYLFARSSATTGYFGGMQQNGELRITDGAAADLQRVATTMDPFSRDVLLQFDVVDDTLSLTAWHEGDPMPDSPQLMVTDKTLSSGNFGFGIGGPPNAGTAQVAFRHFAAVPEPSTAMLSAIFFAGVFVWQWRSRR